MNLLTFLLKFVNLNAKLNIDEPIRLIIIEWNIIYSVLFYIVDKIE